MVVVKRPTWQILSQHESVLYLPDFKGILKRQVEVFNLNIKKFIM